ncbi:enoyl-CoA hydratase/isomerase family protein [Caenispirillum bisanense]|uniref:3-hydroxyisobutyryl-CoA hydrolase n=1 Tax=Caenispirillum bisanense TaxID=414052 RepID=A0A286GFF8_9PROT|nr:enoyl-CoA hydratase/isomerase family protein [Caenispirillum bisanense]SOD94230.1 3-hydroxyisobutyryl-CoA hydrolase [Caenispirillum bisanense]
MSEDEILFAVENGIATITLNRPKAMNALTLAQVEAMDPQLRRWATDDAVHAVVIQGTGEKAFCAGGDVVALHRAGQAKDEAYLARFYAEEYRLNRLIKTYPKPYVALLDGVVMGGGVGVSVHGSHRIATERTLFAMPETGIGMFPDVGGTYFLPRLPGKLGMYLGLTGARLRAADCVHAGVATHYVPANRLKDLLQALGEAETEAKTPDEMQQAVTVVLDMYGEEPGSAPLAKVQEQIDHCFAGDSVEDILARLDADGSEWAQQTRDTILAKSPTATKVAFRQIQVGAQVDFDRAMQIEYRLSQRFMKGPDFFEGVRALLVDKDNAPKWSPADLDAVAQEAVDAFFAPLEQGDLTVE